MFGIVDQDAPVPETSPPESEMSEPPTPPDHDYPVTPATSVMAGEMAMSYDELKKKVKELQHQLETVLLQSRFGLQRIAGSDDNIRFYTRFASCKHFLAFWQLVEPAA